MAAPPQRKNWQCYLRAQKKKKKNVKPENEGSGEEQNYAK
jgi:hypothetical protein